MANPCYQCGERSPGCHGKCVRYKAYRAARDEQLARHMTGQILIWPEEEEKSKRSDLLPLGDKGAEWSFRRRNDMAYDLYRRGRYPQIRRASRRRSSV